MLFALLFIPIICILAYLPEGEMPLLGTVLFNIVEHPITPTTVVVLSGFELAIECNHFSKKLKYEVWKLMLWSILIISTCNVLAVFFLVPLIKVGGGIDLPLTWTWVGLAIIKMAITLQVASIVIPIVFNTTMLKLVVFAKDSKLLKLKSLLRLSKECTAATGKNLRTDAFQAYLSRPCVAWVVAQYTPLWVSSTDPIVTQQVQIAIFVITVTLQLIASFKK